VIVACLGLWLADRVAQRLSTRWFRKLAKQLHIRYSPQDRFNLGARIARCLPDPGASDVRVIDLMYGTEHQEHRYVFTAEYTVGTIGGTRRKRVIARTSEPRGRSCECFATIDLGDPDQTIEDQYRLLLAPTPD
jgi:hypothetical protein